MGLRKRKSFYQWCYDNLSKEKADKLLLRWVYELNVDKNGNTITPKDITYRSTGFNRKGYWFKCLDHPEHKSEQKNINSFTNGSLKSIACTQCNIIAITHPHLIKYFSNKEDIFKYSKGSDKKILMKCPDCGCEKEVIVSNLVLKGFGCLKCSDSISYPEKFMSNVLEQLLDKKFKMQLTKKDFKWCKEYRYDFYISKINCIIETHGKQHYEGETKSKIGNWQNLQEIKNNDIYKEQLAKINNINNYIVLDCRKSELEWIRSSIMNSILPKLLNFKESDIDWLKCHEYACLNVVKLVCELWNNKFKNILKIAKKLKICNNTTRKYLKQGAELGWCNYDPKEEIRKLQKLIICLTTGEIFNSIIEASIKYNIYHSNISNCCKNKRSSAGKLPITNEPLRWQYYSEYIKTNPIPLQVS